MAEDERSSSRPAPGLISSLGRLASTLVEAVRTRIELAAVELEGEVRSLVLALAWGVGALFLLAVGFLLAVLLLVVVFWDTHRILVLGILCGSFLGTGTIILAVLVRAMRRKPPFLSGTLGELAKDRDALRGRR